MLGPNTPDGSLIKPSNLVVVSPTKPVRQIVESLSKTQCLDTDLSEQSISPDAEKFRSSVRALQNLLANNARVQYFAFFIAATKLKQCLTDESQHSIALKKLQLHMKNPDDWDVVFFTNWKEKKPSEKRSAFHLDGERFGDLRIGMSNQKQTVFRVGPHDWSRDSSGRNCPIPAKDINDNELTTLVEPPAGSLVLWDTKNTVHRSPNISTTELNAFGGTRYFATASIGFDRMIDKAITR